MRIIGYTPWSPVSDEPDQVLKPAGAYKGRYYPMRFYKDASVALRYSRSGAIKAVWVSEPEDKV